MNTLQNQTAPWYKHRWPWIIMAGPAIVVVAAFITAYKAVVSSDGVVDDNYYKTGLAVNQELDQRHRALALGLTATALIVDGKIDLHLAGLRRDAAPQSLQLRLTHPTRKNMDQAIELQRDTHATGEFARYTGTLTAKPNAGNWRVVLEDPVADWRMDAVWPVPADPASYSPHLAFSAIVENEAKRQPIDLDATQLARIRQSQQQQQSK